MRILFHRVGEGYFIIYLEQFLAHSDYYICLLNKSQAEMNYGRVTWEDGGQEASPRRRSGEDSPPRGGTSELQP